MTKNKKMILGGLTALASIAAPIVTVVSCGTPEGLKQYDTDDDNKIIIQTGFGSTSNQLSALESMVDEYNTQMKGSTGHIPVDVIRAEGGYGKLAYELGSKILAKKTKDMPNLLVEYADALGVINKYKFAVDFDKTTPKFNKSLINDEFMKVNSQIGGLSSKGTYMVPLGKSTEILGVDRPLLKKVLTDAGYKLGGNKNLDELMANSAINPEGSFGTIDKTLANEVVKYATDDIYTSMDELFKFSNAVAKAYKMGPKGDKFVLGHDSPTNLVYTLAFQKGGYNMGNFLFNKEKGGKGYINYDLFKDGSKENKTFKDIIGEIKKYVDTGALKLAGGGEYTSSLMQQHHVMFSIGSSAGYSHLASSKDTAAVWNKAEVSDGTTKSIDGLAMAHVKLVKDVLKGNKKADGKYWNIFTAEGKKAGKYDIIIPQTILDALKKNVTGSNKFVLIRSESELPKFKNMISLGSDSEKNYAIIPDGPSLIKTISSADLLTFKELKAYPGLAKYGKSDKSTLAFSQGPSFVGVHASQKENNATAMFLNWFYDKKSKLSKDTKTKHDSSAKIGTRITTAFDELSGYITPTTGFKEDLLKIDKFNIDHASKYSMGSALALKSYTVADHIFTNPVDDYSSKLRNILSSKIKSIFINAHTTGKTDSVDKIYNDIKLVAKTDKII